MGYRSDVAINCGENAYLKFMEACKKYKAEPHIVYRNDKTRSYILKWDNVKWYDDWYDDVKAIVAVMDWLDDNHNDDGDYSYAYTFCRIGEDTNDNEERSNGYVFDLYIYRSFYINKEYVVVNE